MTYLRDNFVLQVYPRATGVRTEEISQLIGQSRFKASTTERSNTDEVEDDPDLIVTATGGYVYRVELLLEVEAASADPDFKYVIRGPSGSRGDFIAVGANTSGGAASAVATNLGQAGTFAVTASGEVNILIRGSVKIGPNDGTMALQWAQQTSDAAVVGLRRDSFIFTQRIA